MDCGTLTWLPRRFRARPQVFCVMGREADAFEVFYTQRQLKRTHIVVPAKHNRSLGKHTDRLFNTIAHGSFCGHY